MLVFVEGRKPENPEKNPQSDSEQGENPQPTYGTGPESNPGHIGGKRTLSPLRCHSDLGIPVFWVPRTQIPSVLGIPSRDTQNTGSVKYRRLGQLETSRIRLKNHLYSSEALSQQMKALLILI